MDDHHSHHERAVYQLATLATHFAKNGEHEAALDLMTYSVRLKAVHEDND
jgi:hypothetical protein